MPRTREHFWRRDVTIAWLSAWDATRPAEVSWLHGTGIALSSSQPLRWSKYSLPFTEPKGPLPCSQEPPLCPSPPPSVVLSRTKLHQRMYSHLTYVQSVWKFLCVPIHQNVYSVQVSYQNFTRESYHCIPCYMLSLSLLLLQIIPIIHVVSLIWSLFHKTVTFCPHRSVRRKMQNCFFFLKGCSKQQTHLDSWESSN
jgi:hypothetical protein